MRIIGIIQGSIYWNDLVIDSQHGINTGHRATFSFVVSNMMQCIFHNKSPRTRWYV